MSARIVATGLAMPGADTPADLLAGNASPGALPQDHFSDLDQHLERSSDRVSKLTLVAARAALFAYSGKTRIPEIGIVCGMDYGVYPTIAACLRRMTTEGHRFTSPQEFVFTTPNIAPSFAAIHLGLKGVNTNLSSGSLSSLVAVGFAAELIEWGRAQTLIAGGATSIIDPVPELAARFKLDNLAECAAFHILEPAGGHAEIAGFVHRPLKNGSMARLVEEALQGNAVDRAIFHPGPGDKIDGLPDVPARDIRELAGEGLDAAGTVAVAAASESVRQGSEGVLVAFRDLGGREGAAMVVRRPKA